MALDLSNSTLVRCFPLDLPGDRVGSLARVLSRDELERARRFVFSRDQNRYITGRGQLRCILGAILDREPSSLRFQYGERGKPSLASETGAPSLQFNFSHSHAVGLLAVQHGDELGVDLELVRPAPDALAMARRFFSPAECEALLALPAPEQEAGFFRCWTRKEAILKSCGQGISHPLDTFSVSCTAAAEPQPVVLAKGDGRVTRWLVPLVSPVPSYVAALATAGPPRPIRWANDVATPSTGGGAPPSAFHPSGED